MSCPSSLRALGALSLIFSSAAYAATPASGTLSDAEPSLTWTGTAPFVFTNVTPASGMPQCAGEPVACDVFDLTVDISDKFRADEKNKKERVTFSVSWPNASGAGDFDVYFKDASGAVVGESATGANPEVITVPLNALKNGAYTFEVIPFAPLAENYETVAQLGSAKSGDIEGKQGDGLLLGAFGIPALFMLLGLALRRGRA